MKKTILSLLTTTAIIATISCVSDNYAGKPFEDSEYKGGAQTIPGNINCAFYDFGGEGVAYHDVTPTNHGSGELNKPDGSYLHSFRADEGVDISYTKFNDTDNSDYNFVEPPMEQLYIGWTEAGEWTKYTVNVEKSANYDVSLLYTSNQGGKISISVNDIDATGAIEIPTTYNEADTIGWRQWHHWNITPLGVIKLDSGLQTITLHTVETGQMNYALLNFVPK